MISAHFSDPHRPMEHELRRLDLYVRQAADFIERSRIETALRESEGRFRALTLASSDVVYRMAPDLSEMRYLGGHQLIPGTEPPGGNWLDRYVHPDDQHRFKAAMEEAIHTKGMCELEHGGFGPNRQKMQ